MPFPSLCKMKNFKINLLYDEISFHARRRAARPTVVYYSNSRVSGLRNIKRGNQPKFPPSFLFFNENNALKKTRFITTMLRTQGVCFITTNLLTSHYHKSFHSCGVLSKSKPTSKKKTKNAQVSGRITNFGLL